MRMAVDEARYQPATAKVIFRDAPDGHISLPLTEANDPAGADEHMTNSEVFRSENAGVGEQLQQFREPAKKGPLYYTTALAPDE
jgi:hypothetical protein